MRVVIETLRKRNAAVQCPKTHICVKCAGEHPAKDCTTPRIDLCTCHNSGGQHPPNYKGCTKLQAWRSTPRSGVVRGTEVKDQPNKCCRCAS